MFFLTDYNLKVVFGWSAKCGCSHIKKIFYFLQNDKEDNNMHIPAEYAPKYSSLPANIENYTVIIISRNPYDRLVSGFLQKYNINGSFRSKWNGNILTFSNFIEELLKNKWSMVDRHHFTPQTSEQFNKDSLLKSKKLIIYDIKHIDYTFIEGLYNKRIPEALIQYRGNTVRNIKSILNKKVYDIEMSEYLYECLTEQFYNQELKDKVYNFYINDFVFFKDFNYDIIV